MALLKRNLRQGQGGAERSVGGDEGSGDEVAKAAMRVATHTNPNPNQSVERRLQPPLQARA